MKGDAAVSGEHTALGGQSVSVSQVIEASFSEKFSLSGVVYLGVDA